MKANDIKKAMECCVKSRNTDAYCHECPYRNYGYCLDKMMSDAILLFNRHNAEIEALIEGQETLQKNLPKVIRTDAIKEFAERLKRSSFECDASIGLGVEMVTEAVSVSEIDRLVKEMVGEHDV